MFALTSRKARNRRDAFRDRQRKRPRPLAIVFDGRPGRPQVRRGAGGRQPRFEQYALGICGADFQQYGPNLIPLPHPSWRVVLWMRQHPWFASTLLPALRAAVSEPFRSRWGFDLELLGRLQGCGVRPSQMREEPLNEWRDVGGSKVTTLSGLRTFWELVSIRRDLRKWAHEHRNTPEVAPAP